MHRGDQSQGEKQKPNNQSNINDVWKSRKIYLFVWKIDEILSMHGKNNNKTSVMYGTSVKQLCMERVFKQTSVRKDMSASFEMEKLMHVKNKRHYFL